MKKNHIYILILFTLFLFTGCEQVIVLKKYLDFTTSTENIKINEPVELTVRWCFEEMSKNAAFVIMKLDDVEINVIEGNVLESDDETAIFVDFIRPEKQAESDDESPYAQNPYCKLSLLFKKAGTYEILFHHTGKDNLDSDFHVGFIHYIATVSE